MRFETLDFYAATNTYSTVATFINNSKLYPFSDNPVSAAFYITNLFKD